jgi:cell division septum initiation protein DivIVA
MDIIKLLNELERLIDEQRSVMGLAWNFHPEDYHDITNKIRASLPEEVKRASRVTAESDKIVDGARETAEQTLEDATVEADEIIREARISAERVMRETEAQVNKMSLSAESAAKQTVEESRLKAEKMLMEAHQQSEKRMADAREQSELMLSQSEVVRLATAQAREIVASAEQETQSLRLGADEYAHGVMTDLEKQVSELMATIQRGRMKLDQRVGPAVPAHAGLVNGNGRAPEIVAGRR